MHVRTCSYIERYNAADFVLVRAEVDQFLYLTEKLSPADRGQVYLELLFSDHLEDLVFRHKLWTFTMLYNELGAAWDDGVISKGLIRNFDRLIPRYWMRLRPYMMNLHLRFGFEVPMDRHGFKSEFKLFKSFHRAFLKVQKKSLFGVQIGINPEDLPTVSLLDEENYSKMEKAMLTCRPSGPRRLNGPSVVQTLFKYGYLK